MVALLYVHLSLTLKLILVHTLLYGNLSLNALLPTPSRAYLNYNYLTRMTALWSQPATKSCNGPIGKRAFKVLSKDEQRDWETHI